MKGLPIVIIVKDSASDRAGVKPGDKILAFNDMRVENVSDYIKAERICPDRESMLVERDGKKLYFEWKNEKNKQGNKTELPGKIIATRIPGRRNSLSN